MPKKSTAIVPVEVLPPAKRIAGDQQSLDELVRQKVAEVLAQRGDAILEPFFQARHVANELRRLQNVPEQRKWSVFYERHGCLRCQDTQRPHAGTGMCDRCRNWVVQALGKIINGIVAGDDASGDLRQPAPAKPRTEEDPLYSEAVRVVCETGRGSTGMLQRRLSIGYGRAARMLDMMERQGIVGPAQGSKPREVLAAGKGSQ